MRSDDLAPGFLIAVPQLIDPNFKQSVILLIDLNEEGAMGLVINRESPVLLEQLCADQEIPYSGKAGKKVRQGGPVEPERGLVLYGHEYQEEYEGRPLHDGLYVSASKATLAGLCGLPRGRFHCYAGYAGWGPGQLEQEIGEGIWIHGPVQTESIFDVGPEEAWEHSLRSLGIDPGSIVPGGGPAA